MVIQGLLWYALVLLLGLLAHGTLRRWGFGAGAALATCRVVGLASGAWVAWMAGNLGLAHWWWVAFVPLAIMAFWGRRMWRGLNLRALVEPEAVGLAAFSLLAWLRLTGMWVRGTEKPMDLAILSTLLRPGTFPPGDPWLAGEVLPYYYWGFMPWTLPAKIIGLAPDLVFNLLVPTLAAVTAQAAWALVRSLGGGRRAAISGAFLAVFAGTPEGWKQLLAGTALGTTDMWHASRQITDTITEFPLFTFHLGDLHPHLLAIPLILVTLVLARSWGQPPESGAGRVPLPVLALLYGACGAANPWCAIPVGIGVALLALGRVDGFAWPRGDAVRLWLRLVAVGALGWLLYVLFWVSYHPPFKGMGLVHTPTRWDQLALFLGGALLAPMVVAWVMARRWGGLDAARRQLGRAALLAAVVAIALATGSVGLGLALVMALVYLVGTVRGLARRARPVWALTMLPLVLVAVMETVYLKDPYGEQFYRMNTVFKASHLAFTLLAVLSPALLGWLVRRRPALATAALAIFLVSGLPQLLALAKGAAQADVRGWHGLGWTGPGEVEAAAWLRGQPRGAVLVEAVGDAYSDAARMSAASGVPAVLGWDNHERVWRGDGAGGELDRRKALITELYSCGDAARVREIVRQLGAVYVVLGAEERKHYPEAGLEAVRQAGQTAFSAGECTVVRFGG